MRLGKMSSLKEIVDALIQNGLCEITYKPPPQNKPIIKRLFFNPKFAFLVCCFFFMVRHCYNKNINLFHPNWLLLKQKYQKLIQFVRTTVNN